MFVYNDEGELEPIVGNDDACGLMSSVAFYRNRTELLHLRI